MSKSSNLTRREFVGAAVSAAAVSAVPVHSLFSSCLGTGASASTSDWKDEGVLFLDKSPYAKLHNIPVHAVTITQGFWGARRETNVERSIPTMEKLLEANGRMNNFLRLAGKSDEPQHGPVYSDSAVYKWTEALGFALQSGDRPELRAMADRILKEVVAGARAKRDLKTIFQGGKGEERVEAGTEKRGEWRFNLGGMDSVADVDIYC